ncbi:MAG: hypothetical protein LUD72_12570 [Bacteroidales bacterium]|nr:hypothetical protein [Bacteroidales bacterium]
MADTTEHSKQVMVNAAENIKISFGDALNSALQPVYEVVGNLLTRFSEFVAEHPAITKAVTAITVAFTAGVAGIAAYAAISATATAASGTLATAISAVGSAISSAIAPLAIIVGSIAAVVAVVSVLKNRYDDAYDSVMSMTATTQYQTEELDRLEAEYEEACEQFGATSDEASELKYQIDDLSAEIEANGQSVEEWCDKVRAIPDAMAEVAEAYDSTIESIDSEEVSNMALIAKLNDLASASGTSGAAQSSMQAIIDELNGSIDGLNLTYDDLIHNQDATVDSLKEVAKAQAEQQRYNAMWDEYVGLIGESENATDELAEAQADLDAEQERYNEALEVYNQKWGVADYDTSGILGVAAACSEEKAQLDAAADALEQSQAAYDEASGACSDYNDRIQELEEELGLTVDEIGEVANASMSAEEAANYAIGLMQGEVEELCQSYQEAYDAAVESFEGQFGLFDEAQANMDASVEAAQAALDSQLEYWTTYGENVETLKDLSASDLGITQENYEALMAYVQDGSEEAAGLAASMVEAVRNGDEQAIAELGETLGQVSEMQNSVAEEIADWQTSFSESMEGIKEDMYTIVTEDLELSDEATQSAMATIDAYVEQVIASGAAAPPAAEDIGDHVCIELDVSNDAASAGDSTMSSYAGSIRKGGQEAVSEARSIASQVSSALSGANSTISIRTSYQYATGTTSSADTFVAGEAGRELVVPAHAAGSLEGEQYYMAGENGPELIVGEPGSEVFPTSETDRLIAALNGQTPTVINYTSEASTGAEDGALLASEETDRLIAAFNGQKPLMVENNITAPQTGLQSGNNESTRRIVLEINGSGELNYSGTTDNTDSIVEILQDNIRPILMNIIKEEIYEEGVGSYRY